MMGFMYKSKVHFLSLLFYIYSDISLLSILFAEIVVKFGA